MKKILKTLGLPWILLPIISDFPENRMSSTTLFSSIQNMQSCYLPVCNLHVSNPARTQGEGHGVMGEYARRGHQGRKWKMGWTDLPYPSVLQNTTLADYSRFKTIKILGMKGYVKSQTSSLFFFNCWVKERDEQGFQYFYKKEHRGKRVQLWLFRTYTWRLIYGLGFSLPGPPYYVTFCSTINPTLLIYHSLFLVCSVVIY